jgi:hypothetical protein
VPEDFAYEAFISYAGSSVNKGRTFDREVAEHLHKTLEKYRAPRTSRRGRANSQTAVRKLRKVFLDREEMRASPNLKVSLEQALRASRSLIVVCSPRARQSPWVNDEVSLFKEIRGADYILTLLIEGEPEDAFPAALTAGATVPDRALLPLAADIRSDSRRHSLRLLKREKLRLLAPMLGCSFDDLRQREHRRFVQRMMAAAAVLSLLSTVLAVLSLLLLFSERRATKNYDLALEAAGKVLPMLTLKVDDLPSKEVHLQNAIWTMKTLCDDDSGNPRCKENLRALEGALMAVEQSLGKANAANQSFEAAKALSMPISVARLKKWDPGAEPDRGDLFSDLPDSGEIKRLKDMLSIWEQPAGGPPRMTQAVEYTEYASEYVSLLDARTREGQVEARRVLEHALHMFQEAGKSERLNEQQKQVVHELNSALDRLSSKERG